jgi:hypothetical protein
MRYKFANISAEPANGASADGRHDRWKDRPRFRRVVKTWWPLKCALRDAYRG